MGVFSLGAVAGGHIAQQNDPVMPIEERAVVQQGRLLRWAEGNVQIGQNQDSGGPLAQGVHRSWWEEPIPDRGERINQGHGLWECIPQTRLNSTFKTRFTAQLNMFIRSELAG